MGYESRHIQREIRPSILDRLTNNGASRNGVEYHSMAHMRRCVLRDLMLLLNTRVRFRSPAPECSECGSSILNFGLPDLASQQVVDDVGRQEFAAEIENVIRRHEPRFKAVRVVPAVGDEQERRPKFLIEGLVYADPAPIQVNFDALIDPIKQALSLSESRR